MGREVVPEHSYADTCTRVRWFDVVVESLQRLSLKNRAQSGARGRAGALVGKYGVALVRRRCVESTQRLSPMIRAQSGARGRARALVGYYKIVLMVRRCCGESTMTKSSDSSPKWGSLSCRGTRRQIRGGAGAASLCGEYTTTRS